MALLLEAPDLLPEALELSHLSADAFLDTRNRQIFEWLLASQSLFPLHQSGEDLEARSVRPALALDSELQGRVESLRQKLRAEPPIAAADARLDAFKCVTILRKNHLARLIRELQFMQQDAHDAGDAERMRELSVLIEQLRRERLQVDQRYYAVTLVGRRKPGAA